MDVVVTSYLGEGYPDTFDLSVENSQALNAEAMSNIRKANWTCMGSVRFLSCLHKLSQNL